MSYSRPSFAETEANAASIASLFSDAVKSTNGSVANGESEATAGGIVKVAIVFDFTPRASIVIQVAVYYPQLAEDPLIQARNFRIGGNTMETNLTRQRQHAHELIDKMSVRQVVAAVGLFEAMLDPVEIASANAPHDDEPLTAEEIEALDESNCLVPAFDGLG